MSLFITSILSLLLFVPPANGDDKKIIPADAGVQVIDWKDAAKYMDEEVIVQGRIAETGTSRTMSFLNFDRARSFTAVVRKANYSKFPKQVTFLYHGKIVRIHGVISEYKGKPQIEVSSPDQITVFEKEEPIPPAAAPAPRSFDGIATVGCYNVLNLFDEYDDPYHDDEGTEPKSREALEKLAATIRKANADVLALEEVENRDYLERFVRAMLPDMGYQNVVCIESNDRRGIDCAVLSRFPVGPVTSYGHVRFSDGSGGMTTFRRDLLQVRIEPPGAPCFDVFAIHFKSKGGGGDTERVRTAECRQARKILDGLLEKDKGARFVICGDFNDTWDSKPLTILRGTGATALVSFLNDLPAGTVTFNKEPYRSVIDFILCSPAMAKHYVPKSYSVIDGTAESSGSDHNPVLIKFNLK